MSRSDVPEARSSAGDKGHHRGSYLHYSIKGQESRDGQRANGALVSVKCGNGLKKKARKYRLF
ncbi:hypothetical protein JCM39194_15090 [Desulfotomaculum varum]|jgi:hypothetical protein